MTDEDRQTAEPTLDEDSDDAKTHKERKEEKKEND